jgi:hypothetical protein
MNGVGTSVVRAAHFKGIYTHTDGGPMIRVCILVIASHSGPNLGRTRGEAALAAAAARLSPVAG